jgi:catechol 2,3-dioxygenase-like lactoylglutathione lyase family enzyme
MNYLNADEISFRNRDIFEIKHVPELFYNRESQMKDIAFALKPGLHGAGPLNTILRGIPGTGKTTAVRRIFAEVQVAPAANKNNQGKALEFYTEILGFVKKADITAGNYRWLTVVSPEDQDGTQLVLEPNGNPAAKAYQEALFRQGIPAASFFVDDIRKEYELLKNRGVKFTMEPTKLPGTPATIAVLDDTCGNLIQITQLQT